MKEIVLENKAPFTTVTDNRKVKLVELGEECYIICLNEEEAKRDQAVREEIVSELRKKIASEKKFDGIYVLRIKSTTCKTPCQR